MMFTEKPFFFTNGDYKLFGVIHKPGVVGEKVTKGFVFCHPFAEEKLWVHRAYVSFARELARQGYMVLRFDYMGHGDSEGGFEESTVKTRLSDIKCAVEHLQNLGVQEVGLLGLRFGASLAARAAEEIDGVSSLVMWQPIVNGERYMKDILRTNLTGQMAIYGRVIKNREALIEAMQEGKAVNIDGYDMSYELFTQASDINLLDHHRFKGRALIIQIDKKEAKIKKDIEALGTVYTEAQLIQVIELPFWTEIKEFYSSARSLSDRTVEWLDDRNG